MGTCIRSAACHADGEPSDCMLTVTCILEFSDGSQTSGSVAAITPEGFWPVEYRGAIHRLPEQPTTTTPERLEGFFQAIASETGGQLRITRKGFYDLCGLRKDAVNTQF